jgi:hypothetical protein
VLRAPGASEERADRLAPVAHDLRVAQRDEAEHEAGGGHGDGARQAHAGVEAGARAEGEEEGGRHHAAEDAERGEEADLPGAGERESGHVEHRVVSERGPGQQGRHRGRDRERGERLEGEAAEDDLHGEEGGPDRRVVGAGEAGGDPAPHEHAPLARRDPELLPQARRGRRRHEDDGPLAADRPRRGLGHDRRGGPDESGAQGQDAVAQDHGLEDVPAPRAPRPAEPEGEHEPGDEAAEGGDRHARRRRGEGHALHEIAPRPEEVRDLGRRPAQQERGATAQQADGEGPDQEGRGLRAPRGQRRFHGTRRHRLSMRMGSGY